MKLERNFLFYSLVFLATFVSVKAIKCFQCNSHDVGCSSLTEKDEDSEYLKDCEPNHDAPPFCRKTIQTILDTNKIVVITRGCGWKTKSANNTRCYKNDTQFKLDVTCQCFKDGCNSATSLSVFNKSMTFLSIFVAIVVKLVRF
ncbi:uncharacterized protein [Onthophagus taurus]|uniref:uncharacterized protein n=1 Tax=Onthophagus taurus TaxID=166361 RepID=UPI000C20FA1A|nr:uncharacterized protein LOC111417837 [Onthophagus taurus]